MSYKIDLHIHTNLNPHAYSTLEENIRAAKEKEMTTIAITNHGPALQDSPHWWGLANMQVIPEYVMGVRILKGVEANIIDGDGNIDINQEIYKGKDIILAGFHDVDEYGDTMDCARNTKAIVALMKSQRIDVAVHLGNPRFPIDYEEVMKAAKECNVAIELNNTSLTTSRRGSEPNCYKIAQLAKEYGCYVALGSDSHFSSNIGEFSEVEEIVKKIDFPKEKIVNFSEEKLNQFLNLRKGLRSEYV